MSKRFFFDEKNIFEKISISKIFENVDFFKKWSKMFDQKK